MATMSTMPPTVRSSVQPTRRAAWVEALAMVSCNSETTASRLFQMTSAATPPTTSTFAIALSNSTTPWAEKMRPNPFIGLSREKSGCSGLNVNSQPLSSSGAARAARNAAASTGATVMNPLAPWWPSRRTMRSVWNPSAAESVSPLRIRPVRPKSSGPPSSQTARPTVASRANVLSSCERATCPSSRACSSRRGDAGSVFSKSFSSAMKNRFPMATSIRGVPCDQSDKQEDV